MSAIHFEFDGAEDIAFWVSEDDLFEKNIKVMFDDLPKLKLFLEEYFPGLYYEETWKEDPRDEHGRRTGKASFYGDK